MSQFSKGKIFSALIAFLACLCFSGSAFASSITCDNLKGKWKNQLGSELVIESIDKTTGKLQGKYRASSGAQGTFPVVGWINSSQSSEGSNVNVVSFSVRWAGIGSITSWVGYCEKGNSGVRIFTIWNLVRPSSQFQWDHILTGSDDFRPVQ